MRAEWHRIVRAVDAQFGPGTAVLVGEAIVIWSACLVFFVGSAFAAAVGGGS